MRTMADLRGEQYVAAWPYNITRKLNLSPEYMAKALRRAGLITTDDQEYALRSAFLRREPTDTVGALTAEQAQAAIDQLKAIRQELTKAAQTTCHYCGLDLQADGCPAGCG